MSWPTLPVGRFSGVHQWPLLGVPRGTDALRGFLRSDIEVCAANHFFTDPFPGREKHMIVKYSVPPSRAVKTARFHEGQKVEFTK